MTFSPTPSYIRQVLHAVEISLWRFTCSVYTQCICKYAIRHNTVQLYVDTYCSIPHVVLLNTKYTYVRVLICCLAVWWWDKHIHYTTYVHCKHTHVTTISVLYLYFYYFYLEKWIFLALTVNFKCILKLAVKTEITKIILIANLADVFAIKVIFIPVE